MKKLMMVLAAASLLPVNALKADIITEFGAGIKIPASTSILMLEECHVAQPLEMRPSDPSLEYRVSSCGGDDPIFIGWPIAWEKDFGVWSVRAGWFHFSHWFDGGRDRELHMDAGAVTATFNWTEWKRGRSKR